MRQVTVFGGPAPQTVDVAETASLQQIIARVAKACSVAQDSVRVSCNDRRCVHEVPAQGWLKAAVRTDEAQQAVTRNTEEVSIPPKPVIMHQDMEGFSEVVAFDEVIDNSIRANATCITAKLLDSGGGLVTGLVCSDDGDGMPHDSAVNHMRLAHTDSGTVVAPRAYNKPLAAAYYFSKNLSRHGKGAAALLFFGNKVETITKTVEAAEGVTVSLDYKEWRKEFNDHGTCTYKVKVVDWFDFGLTEGEDHLTSITIKDLRDGIATKLANPAERQTWAQQIADHYFFFLRGFPKQLWDTLPAELLPGSAAEEEAARPAGGLTIDLFGIRLGLQESLPQQMPRPRLSTLLESFLQQEPQPKPFWLPIRWCEENMAVEEVPFSVPQPDDRSGPAGKLRGVHRDFLLLLLYYPYKDGERTKPELMGDTGVEDMLFTAWCGRMIPKAFSPGLPPLVAATKASRDQDASAWMLTHSRLCALLFCSPEVYTSNHKTEILDEAFDAVLKRLGAPRNKHLIRDRLWVRDTQGRWCESSDAGELLVQHHKQHWAPLEQQGELQDTLVGPDGEVFGKAFKPPGSNVIIRAGDLVQLLNTPEDRQAAEAASEPGSSSKGRHSSTRSAKGSSGSSRPWPMSYRYVEYFSLHKEDGPRFKVQLREWVPDWVQAGQIPSRLQSVAAALISPVPPARAKELQRTWNEAAPRYLAWWGAGKSAVYRDISELPGISSARLLSVEQVPLSLSVCFVDSKNRLCDFKKDHRWSSSIYLGSEQVAVTWQLHRGTQMVGAAKSNRALRGATHVKYTLADKARIDNLRELVEGVQDGVFRLTITPKCDWVTDTLNYTFTVAGSQAQTLEVGWHADSVEGGGAVPRVKLGDQLPELEVRAKDSSGQNVGFPFATPEDVRQAMTLSLLKNPSGAKLTFTGEDVRLSNDRQLITITGWKLRSQKLRAEGNALLQAYVGLQLALPGGAPSLQLAQQRAPMLQALSGPPARLEARADDFAHPRDNPFIGSEVSRGSEVHEVKLLLLDEAGNKLDLGPDEDFCARLRFDPPGAAEFVKAKAGSKVAEAQAPASAARRHSRKSAVAAAGAAAPRWWPISVDGNVVEVRDEYRWCVPPGAGPAGIVIQVFKGSSLPTAADAQPLLEHTGWYAMQRIHAVPTYDSMGFAKPGGLGPNHAERWRVWRLKSHFSCHSDPVPFVLNTTDFDTVISNKDKEVPLEPDAAVPEEVLNRFCEGFEPRPDIVPGQLVSSFITPSGLKLSSQTGQRRGRVKGKVPFFLAEYWNSLLDRGVVYEAGFVVASGAAQRQDLAELQLVMCNEADAHDEDFCGLAKLCVLGPDGSLTSVYGDTTSRRLHIHNGLLLPPISINPDWFTADSKGMATLVLLDAEPDPGANPAAAGPSNAASQVWQWEALPQQELGRFYLRLAPAAERLLVMAAGQLFQGAVVELPPQQQSGARGKSQRAATLFCLQEQVRSTPAAGSSRQAAAPATAQGAWSAWSCVPAQDRLGADAADTPKRHVDPRDFQLTGPLMVTLGQPVTLHFVAVDYFGCPAVLSKQQRKELRQHGLLLQPDNGSSLVLDASSVRWNWASAAATDSSVPAAGVEAGGHLGGPYVNSCTFTAMAGCGAAKLVLTHTGSFGRQSLLDVPVLLEAGPVAVDGLRLQDVTVQPHGAPAAILLSCSLLGCASPGSLQLLEVPAEVAAEQVQVKQEPGVPDLPAAQQRAPRRQSGQGRDPRRQSGRRQQAQQQQPLLRGDGDAGNPIEFLRSDDDDEEDDTAAAAAGGGGGGGAGSSDMMQVDEPPAQPQLSAWQQWLQGLGQSGAGLLYEVQPQGQADAPQLVEGCTVHLRLQLFDGAAHEIAADTPGKLLLLRLRNWRELQQQQQQQQQGEQLQPDWQAAEGTASEFSLEQGTADVVLPLGVGDAWVGEQVYQVRPVAAAGQELAATLPVLLRVKVQPGPFADGIRQVEEVQDPAAAAAGAPASSGSACRVTAAEVLQALHGRSTQQPEQELLQQLPALLDQPQQHPAQLTGQECAVLQVSSSGAGQVGPAAAAAFLPEMALELTSRDGSTLPLQSLQPLQMQLQTWVAPDGTAAAAAGGAAGTGAWLPVQQQQQRFGQAAAGAGVVSVQATVRGSGQHLVFEVPEECRQLPPAAGVYRVVAAYEVDVMTETLRLAVGPFLLLPGAPHTLLAIADAQQQQQQTPAGKGSRPVSGSKRGRTSRVPVAAVAAQAAQPAQELVLLDGLGGASSLQQVLQLRDCWGNTWKPAAAKLAARLQATAASAAAGAGPEANPGSPQDTQHDDDEEEIIETLLRKHRETLECLARGSVQAGTQGQPQQQAPSQPASKRQRTSQRTAASKGAPGAAAGTSAAAAGPGEQWVLQLLLFQSTPATEAAAGSSRQAAAAAAGEQPEQALRHIDTLSFDADGCCTVPATALRQLGVDGVGEWQLYGQAVPTGSSAAPGSGSGGSFDPSMLRVEAGKRLQLLLGSWIVVSEGAKELTQKEMTIKSRLAGYQRRVKSAQATAGKAAAELQGLEQRLAAAQAAAVNARKDLQTRKNNLTAQQPPVRLLQDVAAAARQRQLLCGDRQRQGRRMLERPWLQPRPAGRPQQPQPHRPCSEEEVQRLVTAAMLQLCQAQPAVLGPLVTLGAAECHDVAVVLSSYLHTDLEQLICAAESVKQQVKDGLGRDRDMTALDLRELVEYYHCPTPSSLLAEQVWYAQHPQRLLPPSTAVRSLLEGVLDWHRYDPSDGFIGFGHNLVYLNPQLLGLRVDVVARPGNYGRLTSDRQARQMVLDLRQTLWHWKLGNVLVFEKEQHIETFRQRANRAGKVLRGVRLIALDGFTFGVKLGSVNHRLKLSDVTTRFGTAAPEASEQPLDLRLRCIKERQALREQAQRVCQQREAEVQQLTQEREQLRQTEAAAQQECEAAVAEQQRTAAELQAELQQVQQELQKVQQAQQHDERQRKR